MGHERVGILPKTKIWLAIIKELGRDDIADPVIVEKLAFNTLKNVKNRLNTLHKDKGIQAAFGFLVSLSTNNLPINGKLSSVDISLNDNPSPIAIVKKLNEWISSHSKSYEYAELAKRTCSETIAEWTKKNSQQLSLFDENISASTVWERASEGSGFCEVSRLFFSNFTRRYLNYFLEREASAHIKSLELRRNFSQALESKIDDISKHAFETSKITQSFAAGWFNKNAKDSRPSDNQIEGFLSHAFGKIYEELHREGNN